jgi:xylose isomerase
VAGTAARRSALRDLRGDVTAYAEFDSESPGGRGYGFVRLNQLAVDHLLGSR